MVSTSASWGEGTTRPSRSSPFSIFPLHFVSRQPARPDRAYSHTNPRVLIVSLHPCRVEVLCALEELSPTRNCVVSNRDPVFEEASARMIITPSAWRVQFGPIGAVHKSCTWRGTTRSKAQGICCKHCKGTNVDTTLLDLSRVPGFAILNHAEVDTIRASWHDGDTVLSQL